MRRRPGFLLRPAIPGLCLAFLLTAGGRAQGQLFPLRGYYLNVLGSNGHSPLGAEGRWDSQRLRLMSEPRLGPLHLDLAYEHLFLFRQRNSLALLGPASPGTASTDWLDLDWVVTRSTHVSWTQRLDRLSVALPLGATEITLGRQAISWASTLFLTPADPFAPFDPSDPFREYRAGVDAARWQFFPGPLSQLELVVRPSSTPAGHAFTGLARGATTLGSWEVSAWGGVLYDQAAGALGTQGALGGWGVRAEASLRRTAAGTAIVRAALGADRRVTLADRDLYFVAEYQHDGFGAATASRLLGAATSDPYQRGEMQVLGRDDAAVQGSYQIHPLVSGELLLLLNLRDGSLLYAPALTASATEELSLRAGIFLSSGNSRAGLTGIGSEFGAVPRVAYLSLSYFF